MFSPVKILNNHRAFQKTPQALTKLAGSVKIPAKYKNKPLELTIHDAKREYFAQKK